jgi:hypothetical protein
MLTDNIIRETQPKDSDFKLYDAGGLFLLFRSTGHCGWRFKYRVGGHEKLLSFGCSPSGRAVRAPALARRRRVRDATPTRLPDSRPLPPRRCAFHAALTDLSEHPCSCVRHSVAHPCGKLRSNVTTPLTSPPGDQACLRQALLVRQHRAAHRGVSLCLVTPLSQFGVVQQPKCAPSPALISRCGNCDSLREETSCFHTHGSKPLHRVISRTNYLTSTVSIFW